MMEFCPPRYGEGALSDLLPSVEARLQGTTPVLDLPQARRYVVLLIDGLGWHPLTHHAGHAEAMAAALPRASRLTCGVPSTTATSITSLGCGATPGDHGVVGYSFLDPGSDQVVNALTWEGGPADIQPYCRCQTSYERLSVAGQPSASVSLAKFENSTLTRLAYRGADFSGIQAEGDADHVIELVLEALEHSALVSCYDRGLDHVGHGHGVGSHLWLAELERVDDLAAALAAALPADTCLLVTGDHGMINVAEEHRIVVEDHPELQGYRHIAGEPRLRQLYCDDAPALAQRWREFLGERALVLLRDEAVARGWFGPDVHPDVLPRIGDVLVAMTGDHAVHTQQYPREFGLVGMHGSLTPAEMEVPLLVMAGAA